MNQLSQKIIAFAMRLNRSWPKFIIYNGDMIEKQLRME